MQNGRAADRQTRQDRACTGALCAAAQEMREQLGDTVTPTELDALAAYERAIKDREYDEAGGQGRW